MKKRVFRERYYGNQAKEEPKAAKKQQKSSKKTEKSEK